ncbi:transglutaminase domain-containing protein [Flagellimonas sp.]|uniref:transglutaminase domain-containing protein n=1 Tax=Flagellimonas sp. TaxID=2058762 RepID=UPI003B5AF264
MKKNLFILLLIVAGNLKAQDYKFGKVSKEELQETVYAKDSSAVAAYLYKKRSSYHRYIKGQGLELITEVHKRIKIYNTEGFDFATETINLYQGSGDEEKASSIKGYTYTLENGEVVKTKLSKDGVFKSKYSKNTNQVKFTMPNVKAGSVVEFEYKISSPYVQNIDEFIFQHSIPIKKLDASMKILEYFKFNQRQKGFLPLIPKIEKIRDHTLDASITQTSFNLTDVPALKEESFVSSIKNFRSGVKFEIVSLEIPGSIHRVYSKTWDDVVETIYNSSSFGDELNKEKYFKEELDVVLQGVSDPEERIKRVLTFVKQKVKWNSYKGFSAYEGVRKAYKEGTGNSADINLMLVAMLKYARITAHPVLVSTRDHGVPLFPTLNGYNYVVAAAKIGSEYFLLDATSVYSTLDVLPTRALNWYGRMVSEDGNSIEMDLMPKKKSLDAVMMNVDLHEDGSFDAQYRQQYTNNNAMLYRNMYNKGTEDSFLEELEKKQGDIEISDFDLKNNADLDKPIVQSYNIFKEDAFESIAGKLYFSPMFHLCTTENPFKSEKREYPIDYGFPWEDKYIITIKIPEGYKVESLPAPMAIALPDNMGSFKYNLSSNNNTVNLRASISVNTAIMPALYYDGLKEFYRQLVEKESEKVVLSKI